MMNIKSNKYIFSCYDNITNHLSISKFFLYLSNNQMLKVKIYGKCVKPNTKIA